MDDVASLLDLLQPGESAPKELRNWEWFYVKRLCHSYLLNIKGHTGPVSSVAFSPDGKRIVSASADKTVKVWDATPLP